MIKFKPFSILIDKGKKDFIITKSMLTLYVSKYAEKAMLHAIKMDCDFWIRTGTGIDKFKTGDYVVYHHFYKFHFGQSRKDFTDLYKKVI